MFPASPFIHLEIPDSTYTQAWTHEIRTTTTLDLMDVPLLKLLGMPKTLDELVEVGAGEFCIPHCTSSSISHPLNSAKRTVTDLLDTVFPGSAYNHGCAFSVRGSWAVTNQDKASLLHTDVVHRASLGITVHEFGYVTKDTSFLYYPHEGRWVFHRDLPVEHQISLPLHAGGCSLIDSQYSGCTVEESLRLWQGRQRLRQRVEELRTDPERYSTPVTGYSSNLPPEVLLIGDVTNAYDGPHLVIPKDIHGARQRMQERFMFEELRIGRLSTEYLPDAEKHLCGSLFPPSKNGVVLVPTEHAEVILPHTNLGTHPDWRRAVFLAEKLKDLSELYGRGASLPYDRIPITVNF